ncbi:SH3 domain-containing protein [Bacillus andreraoultii]|uniref:SH3 domain-containing protein n=1 Tax=Bacillus andreraoultii TaxID=1499685 RepID=UPI000B9B1C97|nr:SH3 domain-containing protein [Bacillus andreraoultii]
MIIVFGFSFLIQDNSVEAASKVTKYVTASTLNVRSGPSTKYKVIATTRKNQAVIFTKTSGSWSQVKVSGKTGWVSSKYLTTKKPATKSSVKKVTVLKTVTKYVTASTLNVRSGPSTQHKIITSVKKNQAISVIKTSGTWSQVKISGKTGWVSSKYLTATKPTTKNTLVKNLATGLKTVKNNRQLILVTTNSFNTTKADIHTFEKDAKGQWKQVLATTGYIGKHGLTKDKKEGDGKTPVGKFTIGTAFGHGKNPGTKMQYRQITADDVWVDDPKSSLYNTWQSKKKTNGKWKSAENMNHRLYKYGFVINHNTDRIPYKGSAIFFHTGTSYTLGCTATSEKNVLSILKWLDPKKNPVIIQTPMSELNKY